MSDDLERFHTNAAKRIASLKARLKAVRPLSGVALEKLTESYDVELTYTSNALEGNTLSHHETAIVIEKGVTIGGKTVKEHNEAIDHYEAVQAMRLIAARDRPVSEQDVLDLHRIILRRSNPTVAGMYADQPRRITGTPVVLPPPHKIPGLMEAYGSRLQVSKGWVDAFEMHYDLVTIHPFLDGNGRTARLLMNLLLIRDGLPPMPIGPDMRPSYHEALRTRQLAEPLGHDIVDRTSRLGYLRFMANCLVKATEAYLGVVVPRRDSGRSSGRGIDD